MRPLAVAAVVLAAVLGAAGCGTGGLVEAGDPSAGKTIFQQKCGQCHALADAGTLGTVGPNLDDAFAALRAKPEDERFRQNTIQEVVADQIKFAIAPMPNADALFPECTDGKKPPACSDDPERDIADVSTYVARTAGVGRLEGPVSAAPGGGTTTGGGGTTTGGGATTTEGGGTTTSGGGTTIGKQGGGAKTAEGKSIFQENCASCHTLADAGANGTIGPNLDDLKPSFDRVKKQVENGGGGMPAFAGRLTSAQIEAVARYVSDVAGAAGGGGTTTIGFGSSGSGY